MKQTGYKMKEYGIPTKRYCQTLDLKDDPELISEYRKRHTENEAWPEILQGIRSVGILEMEIYILDNRLFMIVETPFDFDWDEAFARLATLPRHGGVGNVYVHLSGCPPGCNICREMADDGADISFILIPK